MLSNVALYILGFYFFFMGCTPTTCHESEFVSIKPQPQSDNTLRFDIAIETLRSAEVQIKYWKNGEGNDPNLSSISADSSFHQITLSLLSPESEYSFSSTLRTKDCEIESPIYKINTGQIPANLTPLSWSQFNDEAIDAHILLQRRTPRGNIHLLNSNGDIVWYQKIDGMVKVSHWTENNTILILYGNDKHKNSAGADIVEYGLSGKKLLHLALDEMDYTAHHEVRLDPDGNIATLVYDTRAYDLRPSGGLTDQKITGDGILIADRMGNVLWKWSVFDHKDPLKDPDLMDHLDDWGHANALSYDSDGNLLLSMRDWNQIWKIDAKTGEVLWKFGEEGDFSIDSLYQFSGQHGIHKNRKGHYMMLDNGRKRRQTRVLSFVLDELNFSVEPQIVIELPDDYYADRMGSACLMDNDNVLVCSPRSGSILVLDPEGKILSIAHVGVPDPYRAEYVRFNLP